MKYNVEQKLFVYETFVQCCSWRKCRRTFCRKYSDTLVPCRVMVYNVVTKLRYTGLMLDKNKSQRKMCDWRGTFWCQYPIRSKQAGNHNYAMPWLDTIHPFLICSVEDRVQCVVTLYWRYDAPVRHTCLSFCSEEKYIKDYFC
jgi:hypothetical protein